MSETPRAIEAVWKHESTRLIAAIARVTKDVGLAEELAQDAMVAALERWPVDGIPAQPGPWLMTAAKRRAIDRMRHQQMAGRKHEEIARELEQRQEEVAQAFAVALDQVIADDVLRLMFTACHPVLPAEGQVALTLRLVGGLSTGEIARAFGVPEKTMGQRIFRAKKLLSEADVAYETPRGEELERRVGAVLAVVYLIFNEGYTATEGEEWMRAELCEEALRLGKLLWEMLPERVEVMALVALMELNDARRAARTGPGGEAVLLRDQDRRLWDEKQVGRGMLLLEEVKRRGGERGYYALQAGIVACHMAGVETDWARIVELYDWMVERTPWPAVLLNRAVAVGMARGAEAGLEALDGAGLEANHLVRSVRADLLLRLGRSEEARRELEVALEMTRNAREREMIAGRLLRI